METPTPTFQEIVLEFHRYRRPYGSEYEHHVVALLQSVGFVPCTGGIIRWGTNRELFLTAHTDTVGVAGANNLLQVDGRFLVGDGLHNIGADDTAGLIILYHLAQTRPDLTLFAPTGEECGGIGSREFCEAHRDALPRVVISLDRRGYGSVITHQRQERTCSDAFAQQLARMLGRDYAPDDTGLFTDSAVFSRYGSLECTNISVGYENAHCPEERLDVAFLEWLTRRLEQMDFAPLLE
jgi:acetylornithine deacetylase/succinyl-diaminopimelate desuccinylase-like protein